MSKKRLDKIIVIDLETTCWEEPEPKPEGESQDVIEVGLALLDVETLQIERGPEILVFPERSTVTKFCTSLTSITPKMVAPENGAIPFVHAMRMMDGYHAKDRTWASYGDFDRKMIMSQCFETGVKYPFGPRHINVKSLIALCQNWSNEVGMTKALELLNITHTGKHHRGSDDAENIAKILAHILNEYRKREG